MQALALPIAVLLAGIWIVVSQTEGMEKAWDVAFGVAIGVLAVVAALPYLTRRP